MALINVQQCNLLKQLIQGLITMRNQQGSLRWEIMIDVVNDLSSYIGFAYTRISICSGCFYKTAESLDKFYQSLGVQQ